MIRRVNAIFCACAAMLAVMSIGSQAQTQSVTRHVRETVINGQSPVVGHLPADQSMRLTLVLPLRNQTELNRFLKALSDPSSPSYRKFLTVEGFTAKFGPTRDDYNAVIQFAQNNGLRVVATSRNRVDLDVTGSVATIEKAFHVTMGLYQHPTENRAFYAPDREPVVDLPFQLWRISGLDNYSIPKPALLHRKPQDKNVTSNAITGSCPEKSFCGSDMRAAYYGGTTLDGTGQSVGLLEYVGTDLTDLDHLLHERGPDQQRADHSVIHGRNAHDLPGIARLRRHRTDPGHDSGTGHGAQPRQPGGIYRIGRRSDS